MDQFKEQNIRVLVCTDVAARGLDIKGISHVYNYDIPKEAKQYIHRIGRTARAGKEGRAINVLSEMDHDNFSRVLREFDVQIKKTQMPKVERVQIQKVTPQRRTGGFGRGAPRGGPRHGSPRRGGPRRDGHRRDGPRHDGPRRGHSRSGRGSGPRRSGSGPRHHR